MESIDLNLTDLEPISLNLNDDFGTSSSSFSQSKPSSSSSGTSSVNFGPGIEL